MVELTLVVITQGPQTRQMGRYDLAHTRYQRVVSTLQDAHDGPEFVEMPLVDGGPGLLLLT